MEKLLVVDGSNLLFQMFYGMPARIRNKAGKLVHGTLGFVGALLKMLRILSPTHVVVLFDGEHENPRTEIDDAYKANRPDFSQMEEEETPFSQLLDVRAALDYLEIRHAETTDCEADDWIAGYAARYGREMQIVIASFDSDFFQLVTPNVTIFRYRGEHSRLCDEAYVCEKFGVSPSCYADFKALVGDKADNISGLCGVGIKTAAKLLKEYGSLDALLLRKESVQKLSLRSALASEAERLKRNQRLIRLSGEAPLPFLLDELVYAYTGVKTGEVLHAIGL